MKVKKGKAKFRPAVIVFENEEELKFFYVLMKTASKWYHEDYDFTEEVSTTYFKTFPEGIMDNMDNDNLIYGIIIGLKKFLGIK